MVDLQALFLSMIGVLSRVFAGVRERSRPMRGPEVTRPIRIHVASVRRCWRLNNLR